MGVIHPLTDGVGQAELRLEVGLGDFGKPRVLDDLKGHGPGLPVGGEPRLVAARGRQRTLGVGRPEDQPGEVARAGIAHVPAEAVVSGRGGEPATATTKAPESTTAATTTARAGAPGVAANHRP